MPGHFSSPFGSLEGRLFVLLYMILVLYQPNLLSAMCGAFCTRSFATLGRGFMLAFLFINDSVDTGIPSVLSLSESLGLYLLGLVIPFWIDFSKAS